MYTETAYSAAPDSLAQVFTAAFSQTVGSFSAVLEVDVWKWAETEPEVIPTFTCSLPLWVAVCLFDKEMNHCRLSFSPQIRRKMLANSFNTQTGADCVKKMLMILQGTFRFNDQVRTLTLISLIQRWSCLMCRNGGLFNNHNYKSWKWAASAEKPNHETFMVTHIKKYGCIIMQRQRAVYYIYSSHPFSHISAFRGVKISTRVGKRKTEEKKTLIRKLVM